MLQIDTEGATRGADSETNFERWPDGISPTVIVPNRWPYLSSHGFGGLERLRRYLCGLPRSFIVIRKPQSHWRCFQVVDAQTKDARRSVKRNLG